MAPWLWILTLPPLLAWLGLLVVPWRPWSTREQLEPTPGQPLQPLSDITVLIPARDEAGVLQATLHALLNPADTGLRIIVIDDQSADQTASLAREHGGHHLKVVAGETLPDGWAGKLWALEQGLKQAGTELVLLLDADITINPAMIAALRTRLREERLDLVSIMAELRMQTFWERLLIPAFIYFFKLLYPFALGNDPRSRLGVAAGGCILVRRAALEKAGAFASLRGALIDDCTLALKLKQSGHRTWIGLSRSVRSHRPYESLTPLWNMVARSAFTQLRYSFLLLLATTGLMLWLFWAPPAALILLPPTFQAAGLAAFLAMGACYLPTLLYYGRSPLWIGALPVTALLYLLMTWTSALRHYRGQSAKWKGRSY